MFINSIKPLILKQTFQIYKPEPQKINFKGGEDLFCSIPEIIHGDLEHNCIYDILLTLDKEKPFSSGYTSNIFKLDDKIIKVQKDNSHLDKLSRELTTNQNIKDYFALKKIQEISPDIAPKPFGLIKNKNSIYLVEEFIEGKHIKNGNLTKEHLSDLLEKFVKLDKNCFFSCDLHPGNIILTDNKKTKLIDFGSFCIIDDFGLFIASDGFTADTIKQILNENVTQNDSRILKTFITPNYKDIKNTMDNPYLTMRSNAVNFEFRTLYSYLLEGNDKETFELFKDYLKLKSEHYHKNLEEFLKTLDFEKISLEELSLEKVEKASSELKKAIKYENLAKEILANPTEDIIQVELAKLQLRTILNLADPLGSPIENPKKLEHAYNQLISLLKDGVENSQGNKKEYFEKNLENFKEKFKNIIFELDQVEIPENENLVKIYSKILNKTKMADTKPKKPNKINLAIISLVIFITGITTLMLKKNSSNPKNKS